ncbi:hypothetical protein AAHA92_09364 [Salvia divinorum]|uniref:Uncharacterized protein n=1 Tax=Salvia divinorum TaxID=28513 RepID=A0ABD1HR95_SALDI
MECAEVDKGSNEREKAKCMEGYDGERIPSSVFSRKSGAEWSGTSTDSLFSLQMGSNSFSNDYAHKSGDLPRLDESHAPAPELTITLPPVMEQDEGSLHSGDSSSRPANIQDRSHTPITPSVSPTLNSQISDVSNKSFAFPVLVSASGKEESARMMGMSEAQEEAQPQPRKPRHKWFSCFSCAWPRRC